MIAVSHQEAIEVYVTEGGVVAIKSYSLDFDANVIIYIQPENVEILCASLEEAREQAMKGESCQDNA